MTRLSAVDFLGLAEQRRVARVDLSEVGYNGTVFVCDLSTAKQQEVMARPKKGRTRIYNDKSMDIDWADMPADAGPKFLAACMVTDTKGGEILEKAFEATDEDYIVISAGELVLMYDLWMEELNRKSAVMDKLAEMPNAVTDLIVRRVREISGMGDDEDTVQEKKRALENPVLLFAHKLVLNGIGGRTVDELNETMTVDEFFRWLAFSTIEPIEPDRSDWRSAMIMAQQANLNRPKGRSAYPVDKFLPRFQEQKKEQSMQQMELALMSQFASMGGKLPS